MAAGRACRRTWPLYVPLRMAHGRRRRPRDLDAIPRGVVHARQNGGARCNRRDGGVSSWRLRARPALPAEQGWRAGPLTVTDRASEHWALAAARMSSTLIKFRQPRI